MASVEETEKLGLGLNLIEALNKLMLRTRYDKFSVRSNLQIKIQKVIELMDEVLC